ncbi:Predicted nucleic-acid-binding protein, contains PIN domain [Collimonas sp. OK242]|jgi:predicted nucleic-acid-binding protein|uniref:PIN domain-containing protein n=1 Tax=Collimonas sp. OK242 TaxID=1798195 RepID=UPI00089D7824|nr:type II toxin-antitoxin system VapC family toxin [Collimonas sp. OK242]SDX80940.1 Predicted nucleic-acid-binding protein, contains PIN domain [Collimonas sp. OK242]
MIGLDTNVLVRYVAQDDPKQSPKATALIESLSDTDPGFISLVAVVELVWVMQGCYQATKDEVVAILEKLLRVRTFKVENAEIVLRALHVYARSNADFADCLIERSADAANCMHTMTFDSKSAKNAGMRLIG